MESIAERCVSQSWGRVRAPAQLKSHMNRTSSVQGCSPAGCSPAGYRRPTSTHLDPSSRNNSMDDCGSSLAYVRPADPHATITNQTTLLTGFNNIRYHYHRARHGVTGLFAHRCIAGPVLHAATRLASVPLWESGATSDRSAAEREGQDADDARNQARTCGRSPVGCRDNTS